MKIKILKSNKGIMALTITIPVTILFLLVVFHVSQLAVSSGKLKFIHQTNNSINFVIKEIVKQLNGYESCFYTFNNPTNQKNQNYIVTQDIKNSKNQSLFALYSKVRDYEVYLKESILCFDKNSETKQECKGTKNLLVPVLKSSKTHYISNESVLYLNLYAEGDLRKSKTVPIFIELDENKKLIRCSTSEPVINSQICKAQQVSKTCCRHRYTFTLPEVNKLTNTDQRSFTDTRTPPSSSQTSATYSCLPSSSDPHCAKVDVECEASLKKAQIEARCLDSGWIYQSRCY